MISEEEKRKGRRFISRFSEKHTEVQPLFYVITGSHLYGFPSKSSDIDIRGVHIAPGEDYMNINKPAEQFRLNSESKGYEQFDECDFVSYELRKFGLLLSKMNFNVFEMLNGFYITEPRRKIDQIYRDLKPFISNETPKHYLGMAKHNYHKYLANPESDSYTPLAKKYLYVFRGILGAIYSNRFGRIEANINQMADKLTIGYTNLIEKLVTHKKEKEGTFIPPPLRKKAKGVINSAFSALDERDFGDIDKGDLIRTIDEWMLYIREVFRRERK